MAPSIFFELFHQNDAQCHEKITVPMFTLHFFGVLKNVIWAQGSPKKHEKRQKKKRTLDAHRNQYTFPYSKNHFEN